MAKQRFTVTWEMTVMAESKDEAEAMMQNFAMKAEHLDMGGRHDNFDTSSLKHSELVADETFAKDPKGELPIRTNSPQWRKGD